MCKHVHVRVRVRAHKRGLYVCVNVPARGFLGIGIRFNAEV